MTEAQYQAARISVLSAGLRQQRPLLLAAGAITAGTEPDWEALARGLLNDNSWNGTPLNQFPTAMRTEIQNQLGRVNRIARHISDAGDEQERNSSIGGVSWGQIGRAFLSNPFGMIGALFQGLFALFTGGGMQGFRNALAPIVAPIAAEDVRRSVLRRLTADTELRGGRTGPLIAEEVAEFNQIADGVEDEVRGRGRLPRRTPAAASPSQLTPAQSGMIRTAIRAQVLGSLGLVEGPNGSVAANSADTPAAHEGIANLRMLNQARPGEFDLTNDTGRQNAAKLADKLTEILYTVATDGAARTPEQISNFIRTELERNGANMGLSTEANDPVNTILANKATIAFLQSPPRNPNASSTLQFLETANQDINRLRLTIMGERAQAAITPLLNQGGALLNRGIQQAGNFLGSLGLPLLTNPPAIETWVSGLSSLLIRGRIMRSLGLGLRQGEAGLVPDPDNSEGTANRSRLEMTRQLGADPNMEQIVSAMTTAISEVRNQINTDPTLARSNFSSDVLYAEAIRDRIRGRLRDFDAEMGFGPPLSAENSDPILEMMANNATEGLVSRDVATAFGAEARNAALQTALMTRIAGPIAPLLDVNLNHLTPRHLGNAISQGVSAGAALLGSALEHPAVAPQINSAIEEITRDRIMTGLGLQQGPAGIELNTNSPAGLQTRSRLEMVRGLGGDPHLTPIVHTLTTTINSIRTTPALARRPGDTDLVYAERIHAHIQTQLTQSAAQMGFHAPLDPAHRNDFIAMMAVTATEDYLRVTHPGAAAAFNAEGRNNTLLATLSRRISRQIETGIRDTTRNSISDGITERIQSEVALWNRGYLNASWFTRATPASARAAGRAPNEVQQWYLAELTAQAVVDVTTQRNLLLTDTHESRIALADAVANRVRAIFNEQRTPNHPNPTLRGSGGTYLQYMNSHPNGVANSRNPYAITAASLDELATQVRGFILSNDRAAGQRPYDSLLQAMRALRALPAPQQETVPSASLLSVPAPVALSSLIGYDPAHSGEQSPPAYTGIIPRLPGGNPALI